MPLKINIAISRKVGEPNYSSRGATVGLDMEVDSNLVNQPRQLHRQIARLFRLAKESVDRQLERPASIGSEQAESSASQESPVRSATPAQIRAVHAIVNSRHLDLVAELRGRFGVDRVDDLTVVQASQLIDAIKQTSNGMAHHC